MATQVSPSLEKKIAALVASGKFTDADDVLNQAVRLLESRESKLEWLRAAIAEPDAQPEFGGTAIFSAELMEKLDREAEEAFLRGEQPSFNDCPLFPEASL